MRDGRLRPLPLAALVVLGLLLAAIPVVVLTDTGPERELRELFGIGCVAQVAESEGWREEEPLAEAYDEPRAVTLGGKIYLAGGIDELVSYGEPSPVEGVDERTTVEPRDEVLRFDPATGAYEALAPLPEPRNHFGLVTHGGRIYAIGGEADILNGEAPATDVFEYDPRSDRWRLVTRTPIARTAMAVGVIGDRLYLAGGLYRGEPRATLVIYDFDTGRWSRGPDMPTARQHVMGTVAGGRFYVLGGRNERTDALDVVEAYDPRTNSWQELAPLPQPTGGGAAVTIDDRPIVVGGGDDAGGTVTGAVQRYDPARDRWEQLPQMRTPRHGFGAAVAGGRLYAFAGSPCARFAATDIVESFDVSPQPPT